MEPTQTPVRPWYKKKRYIIPIGIAAILALNSIGSASPAPSVVPVVSTPTPTVTQQAAVSAPTVAPVQTPTAGLSNNNHYTNVDGNQVHSPAYSATVPSGASAQCRDGTYSFSQHRSGTCSHHGGVAEWL